MKSNKIKQIALSTLRSLALLIVSGAAFIFLFGMPDDDSKWWMEIFIASKVASAIAFYITAKLYKRWSKTDKWIKAYDEYCNKGLDTPNPLYIGKEGDQ